MNFITTREAAEKWGISPTRITILANQGRIPGAQRVGRSWLIPANAAKPADLRASRGSVAEESDTDDFSFALYPFRPDWDAAKETGLSGQERELLLVENAILECRFKEAYALLGPILSAPGDVGTEIIALCIAGLCSVALNRPGDFSRFYFRVQALLSEDFPHREDYAVAFDIVRSYVATLSTMVSSESYNTGVHYQCLPTLCTLIGYTNLSKETMQAGSSDPVLLELILRFLETTSAVVSAEFIHIYLISIYSSRQNTAEAERHAKAAVKLAYESKYYFPLITYYRYYVSVLSSVLAQYPEGFQAKIQALAAQYEQNYAAFLLAVSESAIVSRLTGSDFTYVFCVLQDLPNKLIASKLGVSEHTVKRKLSELCAKLGVSTKKALRNFLRDCL